MNKTEILQALTVLAAAFGFSVVAAGRAVAVTWQQLAEKYAAQYDAWLPIVLATVEAETEGNNVIGDDGNALGYGQVWPHWHRWAFEAAASDLEFIASDDIYGLRAQVIDNPDYSMAVAVLVIRSFWTSTPGPESGPGLESRWEAFTKRYVGPGIPAADLERRRRIWTKYKP